MWRFRLEVCASQTQRQGDVWEEDTASFPLKNPFPAPALHLPPLPAPICARTSSHTWALRFVVYMAFHLYYDHLLMILSFITSNLHIMYAGGNLESSGAATCVTLGSYKDL